MLRSRIIPCLLIHDNALTKTIKFSNHQYIGDPINAVKIFNEKFVDELIILDIDATVNNHEPNYDLIEKIANESRMPLCYGGGIKNADQAEKIIQLGVEKVSISSAAIENTDLINQIIKKIGSQSIVVALDLKSSLNNDYQIVTHNAKKLHDIKLNDFLEYLSTQGIGELLINSVDLDGTMLGPDIKLIHRIRKLIDVPITSIGGIGKFDDIKNVIEEFKIIGIGVGSLFIFKGVFKAVLINYLNDYQKNEIKKIQSKFI